MRPTDDVRTQVAEEAARLIYDEGMRDYRLAKLRAAEQLGVGTQSAAQPGNEEVEAAIHRHIRLFDAIDQPRRLRQHREVALEAMVFLQAYRPYLTGAALEGTSSAHSAVTLTLTASGVEEVMLFLEEHHIPFQLHERKMRVGSRKADYFPLLRFYVDGVEVELMVFPDDGRFAAAPVSPVTGKALRRADYRKVAALLAEAS